MQPTNRPPSTNFLPDRVQHSVYTAGELIKNPGVSLLPDSPMHKNGKGVEVASHGLGDLLPGMKPPFLRHGEALVGQDNVNARPLLEKPPYMPSKSAVHE